MPLTLARVHLCDSMLCKILPVNSFKLLLPMRASSSLIPAMSFFKKFLEEILLYGQV